MAERPYTCEIDWLDPVAAYAAIGGPGSVFLDSARADPRLGRYSYIGVDPFLTVSSRNGRIRVAGSTFTGNPFAAVQRLLRTLAIEPRPELPPFQGGLAGLFGYDLVQHLEQVPAAASDDMEFPDLALGAFDCVVAFNLAERRAWIVSSGLPEIVPEARLVRRRARADALAERLTAAGQLPELLDPGAPVPVVSGFTRPQYEAAVARIVELILDGDIFQANLSQRFSAYLPNGVDAFSLYRRLRAANPAPFSAFLDFGDTVIASASPERFLRLDQGRVETRPIKGTRPRGATPTEDAALVEELRASAKDRAENVMIVDLLRNDLSRVCRDGTVETPEICAVESFATVHHLVSTVTGELREGCDAVDLLRATFPGGSITGAPKIRAMEIIAELEPTRRGPYCGAIGWLGFDGTMDTSITIRTFALKERTVTFQAGGGIVADSDPAAEYDETIDKARALFQALGGRLDPADR
jgi:para-aminobenzoate synthetase component 1